ncbi:uncharacterized protein At3g49055 isoform X2 [Malania oleifera]|uniref:uncharacterized protein At3g49055 isoform X2 n=1 Tax=Malania oleifera TaxID=397392 RepID=UPI0025AE730B|nr:uncharacterized protein At3g49055 isoform X2 [Malania oleifera]
MDVPETPPNAQTSDRDDELRQLRTQHDSLLAELEALRSVHKTLHSKNTAAEANSALLKQQKDEALKRNFDLTKVVEEVSSERGALRDENGRLEESYKEREEELVGKIEEEVREREELRIELEVSRRRMEELGDEKRRRDEVLARSLDAMRSVKEGLERVIESVGEEKVEIEIGEGEEVEEDLGLDDETRPIWEEIRAVSKLVSAAEAKVGEYVEMKNKEKRELESSVVSLTEENRDINSLLRIALVEKEAVEKSLNRLKGNNDQKRVAILQIAERGLKAGFGFMLGAPANEPSSDNSGAVSGCSKSDGSECEEEAVSLASTVEKIMKNLRLEITHLRKALEESRSDTERLQSLTGKQAQKIAENTLYIKELEHRETVLAQNVEELLMEIKETEEEVARWREACELEVEAGQNVVEECDKVAAILKQELEKTKAALDISNSKLKLKEELAGAAMAAQAAAEKSLQLADGRAAVLRVRIEELTRQLEEAEKRERNSRRRVRHICWPWRILKFNPTNTPTTRFQNIKRMLPDMQPLLHQTV